MFHLLYDREKGESMVATLGANSEFAQLNIDNTESLEAILSGWSFSVHRNLYVVHSLKC